jgi:hypothetical protein
MVLVVASGFVGRYLYVRIPKSIRGEELSRDELEQRAAEVKRQLDTSMLSPRLRTAIEEEEQHLLSLAASKRTPFARMRDAVSARRRAAGLRRQIRAAVLNRDLLHDALELAQERALLLRRMARLETTRRLFQLWHVFHRPLVWLMFFVLLVHLGVAVYFGYVPFGG